MESIDESDEEVLEGADLCIGCLFPVRPGSELCVQCGAPHGSYSAVLPFLKILAEGYVYRQAVQRPRSWITVVGIWVIFGVQLLPLLLIIPMYVSPGDEIGASEVAVISGYSGMTGLVAVFAIFQSTNNFQRWRRERISDQS
jgi:hypothetical protein